MSLLPDLGPHAAFIWAAYALVAVTLAGLVGWVVLDERTQRRLIAELESKGARRRPSGRGRKAS